MVAEGVGAGMAAQVPGTPRPGWVRMQGTALGQSRHWSLFSSCGGFPAVASRKRTLAIKKPARRQKLNLYRIKYKVEKV